MAKIFKAYKEQSKINWGTTIEENNPLNREQIQLGCMLRIADSLENMEQPFARLISERERYERLYKQESASNKRMAKRIAAYQGIIKRMKKQKQGNI